jgi:hypothetical protein
MTSTSRTELGRVMVFGGKEFLAKHQCFGKFEYHKDVGFMVSFMVIL